MLKPVSKRRASYRRNAHVTAIIILLFILGQSLSQANKYAGYDDPSSNELDSDDDYALDLAIKLKREYADDLVSDLFATSYGLEKIARVADLGHEHNIFHFKLATPLLDTENMASENSHARRRKRHVYNKVEELRLDDRVEYVLPQKYLKREKRNAEASELYRELEDIIEEELEVEPRKKSSFDLESFLEAQIDHLSNKIESERKVKRKNMQEHLAEEVFKQMDIDEINALNLEKEINFNDNNFKQEWYLINDGQLNIPNMHDLNVKNG